MVINRRRKCQKCYLIAAQLSIVDRISVPTVEKGSDFFACTLVFHNGYGNQQALFSV